MIAYLVDIIGPQTQPVGSFGNWIVASLAGETDQLWKAREAFGFYFWNHFVSGHHHSVHIWYTSAWT